MTQRIALADLKRIVDATYFANEGDDYERTYWAIVKERFPNCEAFWKHFVILLTNRIVQDHPLMSPMDRILPRDGVSEDIKSIALTHYSTFMHLLYCHDQLENRRDLSFFENFYMHLGTTCDLAEEFLLKVYLLILECTGRKSGSLQGLSRKEFLARAGAYYDKNYSKLYENYLRKGKGIPLWLPAEADVLKEFLGAEDWRYYSSFTRPIREYRNVIAHDVLIGRVLVPTASIVLVPKKEKIQTYRVPYSVNTAAGDLAKLSADFIDMKEQMIVDMWDLQETLNRLWEKPISELKRLLFEDRNETLLRKYNLDVTPDSHS